MKVIITASEAMEKGVWKDIQRLFGRDAEEEIWPNEEFILTEEQALSLQLIRK
ncbi:hypothetical protein LJK88_20855 [Paenibacillus sp. P26]|nr:hypothetical protein LJK88_20855 [Paenibacillus sp. P26]UUZ95924.1 hypothetical protein LJK87_17010 [Paenibacillus sp. P25]